MKWKGRRQSTNVVDVRGSTLSIAWSTGGNYNSSAIIIDTDGSTYGSINPNQLNIQLIPAQERSILNPNEVFMPVITAGQLRALYSIVNQIPSVNKQNMVVSPPQTEADTNLVQVLYRLIENN